MLLNNIFSPISFGSGAQHEVLDVFSKSSGKKYISLDSDADVTYIAVLDNADVDISFDLSGGGSNLKLFGIFVGDVKSQILTSLLSNNSFASVHLFCIVKDDSTMYVDGNVIIGKNIEQVEGHLLEEQFLLGTPKHLLVRPILDINSHRVKASHGAKIHTLDKQKLFYMMSKGLSLEQSQIMVIKGGLQSIFDRISDIDEEKKQKIFKNIIDSIFNSLENIG